MALVRTQSGQVIELPDIFAEGLPEDIFVPPEDTLPAPAPMPEEEFAAPVLPFPPEPAPEPVPALPGETEPVPAIDEFFAPAPQEAPVEPQPEPTIVEQRTQGTRDVLDEQRDILGEQAETREEFGTQIEDLQTEQDQFLAESAKRIEASEAQFREESARVVEEMKSEAAAVAAMKVDPDRLWEDASTPRKIAASVLMFLGGGLAVTTGTGKNPAMETFNQAIERDINAQKANIANAKQGFLNKKSIYQMDLERLGSDVAAANQHRLRGLADLKTQLQTIQARISNADQQANIASALKQVDLREQEIIENQVRHLEGLSMQARKQSESERSARAREALAERGQNIQLARLAFDRAAFEANQQAKKAAQGLDPNDPKTIRHPETGEILGRFVGTDSELKEFRKENNSRFDVSRKVADLRVKAQRIGRIYRGLGKAKLQSAEAKELEQQYEAIRVPLLKAISGAQVSDKEAKRLEAMVPPPLSIASRDNVEGAWRQFQSQLADTTSREFRSHGINYDWHNDFLAKGSEDNIGGTPQAFFLSERIGALEDVMAEGSSPEEVKKEAVALANWLIENPGHPDVDLALDVLGEVPRDAVTVFQRDSSGSLQTVDLRMEARMAQDRAALESARKVEKKKEQEQFLQSPEFLSPRL